MEDVKVNNSQKPTGFWTGLCRSILKAWYRKDLMVFWGIVVTLYVLLVILLLEKYVFHNI